MLKDKLVVLTEEEYEALQDSRFAELPALLVGDLRHALESATPDTRMGCLLRNLLPYLRKPQVPAEVIALVDEGIDEVRDAMAAVPLSGRMSDERQEVDRKALAGFRLAVQSYTTCVEALLAAVEAAPPLEARKPQVDAEVIARTQGALIGWQNADEFDTEELQEHGDVLRDATRALLAAVEAAPEGEPPRVLRWEGYAEPGPDEGRDVIVRIHCDSIAARRFCGTGKIVHVESAVEAPAPAPDEERLTEAPAKHRFAEWCGENFAAIWYEFSLLRDELGLPQPECDEEASGSAPTPDFETMSADDLRAWLDERGRLYEGRATGEEVLFHAWFGGDGTVGPGRGSTREAALLALCQEVAAKEGSC